MNATEDTPAVGGEVLPNSLGRGDDICALILALDSSTSQWVLFEGTFNAKRGSIAVINPIQYWQASKVDTINPPLVAVKLALSVSAVRKLSIWIP